MAGIFEQMHGLSPVIEEYDFNNAISKYANNAGVGEKDSTKYFAQLWMAFAWAAILGFINDKSIPVKTEKGEKKITPFKYDVVASNSEDVFYCLILCAVSKKGYKILENPSEINGIISEYANGGFEIIYTILRDKGDDYFNDSNNYIRELIERSVPMAPSKSV